MGDNCTWPDGPEACAADPKGCFPCKLEHWRTNGGLSVHYPYGRDQFHGQTIRERQEKQIADARSAGIEPEPVGTRWV